MRVENVSDTVLQIHAKCTSYPTMTDDSSATGMNGIIDATNVVAANKQQPLIKNETPLTTGGRLKFYKDGRFILELARAREGDRMAWFPVPRKTMWPSPATISTGTTPSTPRQESSTSLSVSDDNSSIQSSPWQRDHSWKQTTPRCNVSSEMNFFYSKPLRLKGHTIKLFNKLLKRRPFYNFHDRANCNATSTCRTSGIVNLSKPKPLSSQSPAPINPLSNEKTVELPDMPDINVETTTNSNNSDSLTNKTVQSQFDSVNNNGKAPVNSRATKTKLSDIVRMLIDKRTSCLGAFNNFTASSSATVREASMSTTNSTSKVINSSHSMSAWSETSPSGVPLMATGTNPTSSSASNCKPFKTHLLRYEHQMVSPRKRILRELERGCAATNDSDNFKPPKFKSTNIGPMDKMHNGATEGQSVTASAKGSTPKSSSNYSINSLLGNVKTEKPDDTPDYRKSKSVLLAYDSQNVSYVRNEQDSSISPPSHIDRYTTPSTSLSGGSPILERSDRDRYVTANSERTTTTPSPPDNYKYMKIKKMAANKVSSVSPSALSTVSRRSPQSPYHSSSRTHSPRHVSSSGSSSKHSSPTDPGTSSHSTLPSPTSGYLPIFGLQQRLTLQSPSSSPDRVLAQHSTLISHQYQREPETEHSPRSVSSLTKTGNATSSSNFGFVPAPFAYPPSPTPPSHFVNHPGYLVYRNPYFPPYSLPGEASLLSHLSEQQLRSQINPLPHPGAIWNHSTRVAVAHNASHTLEAVQEDSSDVPLNLSKNAS